MKLIVGLGNPGAQYARTRHNIGWRLLEAFAARHRIALDGRKWNAVWGQGEACGQRVALLMPQTFMNLSGEAAAPAARFFKVETPDVVAVHDELDLPFGRLMLKQGGGSAGHNGLKSLTQHLGGPEYIRLRLGIDRPPPRWEVASYVLASFTGAEESQMDDVLVRGVDALEQLLQKGLSSAMNSVNRKDVPAAR